MPTNFANVTQILYSVKYDSVTNTWPPRPDTNAVVFWLALSETAPNPTGAKTYDVVKKGSA